MVVCPHCGQEHTDFSGFKTIMGLITPEAYPEYDESFFVDVIITPCCHKRLLQDGREYKISNKE
ncbi:MAG: hypothetical protein ACTSRI_02635 [Promethearchaeota archaeon]